MGNVAYRIKRIIAQIRNILLDYYYTGHILRNSVSHIKTLNKNIHPPHSTDYGVLMEIFTGFKLDSNDVFVDVGSGFGRVLSFVNNKYKPKRLIGYELVPEYANFSRSILSANIEIKNTDILKDFPKEATVFFLFNPLGDIALRLFEQLVKDISTSDVKIIFFGPDKNSLWSDFFSDIHVNKFKGFMLKGKDISYTIISVKKISL